MDIIVKKFEPSLNAAAVAIWNEVVEEGMAFPQTETLDHPSGLAFFSERPLPALRSIRRAARPSAFISCIPTTWADAATSATRAMP